MGNSPAINPWLVFPVPAPQARLRLFCFPYAGGAASAFRNWPEGLPRFVEVCSIQLPGHGTRLHEGTFTRLQPLIEALAQILTPYLNIPFAFFGHSMGALVSFELARLLRREHGPEPVHLFVSGRRAPQLPGVNPPTYDLPDPEFVNELRRLNGTPKEVLDHTEMLEIILPGLRADFETCQTYSYTSEPPLNCPISAFGGLQDKEVPRDNLEAWRDQTTASFVLRMYPGDHFFLHKSQFLLLRTISQDLHYLLLNSGGFQL